jgi:hypothetical protein
VNGCGNPISEELDEFAISPVAVCAWIAIALIIAGHVWRWVMS